MEALPETTSVAKAFDLTGKVAVVTGAASGIGRATAIIFGGAGAKLVLGDIEPDGLEATAAQIKAAGGTVSTRVTDVSKKADVDALVAQAVSEHGRLDIMANIAGIGSRALVVDITDEQLDHVIGINLKGVLYGCQAAVRVMEPQGPGGCIVNVASGIVDGAGPTYGPYAMTKAAVQILSKTLAAEAAGAGIRVNSVAPGVILSNFSLPHFQNEDGSIDEERKEAYKTFAGSMSKIGRIGTPADVAWSILYLVSDAASFVTGHTMRPNGGTTMV